MSDLIAGRELDIQIASRVMDWGNIDLEDDEYWGSFIPKESDYKKAYIPSGEYLPGEVRAWRDIVPHYSTNRNDAEKVVEKLAEIGWQIVIEPIGAANGDRQRVYAKKLDEPFNNSNLVVDSQIDAEPLAICSVALHIVELEEKDKFESRNDSGGGEA